MLWATPDMVCKKKNTAIKVWAHTKLDVRKLFRRSRLHVNAIAYEVWLGEIVAGYRRCRKYIDLETELYIAGHKNRLEEAVSPQTALKAVCGLYALGKSRCVYCGSSISEGPEYRGQKGHRRTT